MNITFRIACTAVLLLLVGQLFAHDHHAPTNSNTAGVASLDVYTDGDRLHLLLGYAAPGDKPDRLEHRVSTDGGETWSEPVRINGPDAPGVAPLGRGRDAQIAAMGDDVIAVWTSPGRGPFKTGPLAVAASRDGGKTWSVAASPTAYPLDAERGARFPALCGDGQAFHLVWIDAHGEERSLGVATTSDVGRTWSELPTPDAKTCACCQNQIAALPNGGAATLYRDVEPSDMRLATLGSTDASITVGAFGWWIDGCPHVGGGLSWGGGASWLHAAVWTGKAEAQGVYALRSGDAGKTWSPPTPLGSPSARWPDIAAGPDAMVVAAWVEVRPDAAGVVASVSRDAGATWGEPFDVSARGVGATHPRVVATRFGPRIFWTQRDAHGATAWRSQPLTGR